MHLLYIIILFSMYNKYKKKGINLIIIITFFFYLFSLLPALLPLCACATPTFVSLLSRKRITAKQARERA
jgi:hypothetical protein